MADGKILAAVMIKSAIGSKPDARMTLRVLGMHQVNILRLMPNTPSYRSMLQIAKDYVTWGTVSEEFAVKAIVGKGKLTGDKPVSEAEAKKAAAGVAEGKELPAFGIKRHLRLHPPTGGYKGSLKRPLAQKGEVGDRKEKIEALLARMI